ncbi:hypothetical protein [Paracoccus versutus]|uniref:hypothetical protein n=1 Tax=Paracoccus versutus TaxID=34007 RepID=UPI001AA053C0|nr:hypothetical protein [Paracoccus versutus]
MADRFDAGVRLGGEIARDMIAVRIGPDIPMAIVGSPDYFRQHAPPTAAAQLVDHRAINLRLPTSGPLNGWRRPGNPRPGRGPAGPDQHRPDPRCGIGRPRPGLSAAGPVRQDLDDGRLRRVLARLTPDLPGYHLYYPHRHHASSAFTLLVETLRWRG